MGRGEIGDAARLEKNGTSKLSLDHVIKERYPTFVDALRDLDDALSMLFLFASLPSTTAVPPKTIRLCQRLCHEFQLYVIASHSLRKSFLSIKGVYYQASVHGQDIMWLTPYRFVQNITGDVDFRIMGTFIEFYTTLLGFVNYRLYSSQGLVYPPRFDVSGDELGAELGAFSLEGLQLGEDTEVQNTQLVSKSRGSEKGVGMINHGKAFEMTDTDTEEPAVQEVVAGERREQIRGTEGDIDKFEVTASGADVLPQPAMDNSQASKLFASLHVYLSRESPRQPLEFILKSCGCKRVSWSTMLGGGAFTDEEKDPSITHQIIDRPSSSMLHDSKSQGFEANRERITSVGNRYPGRTYVQPQWVWDCMNAGELLRPDLYAPGAILPPHISPWVKAKPGTYDPTLPLADQNMLEESDSQNLNAHDSKKEHKALDPKHANERNNAISKADGISDDNSEASDAGSVVSPNDEDRDDEGMNHGSEFTRFSEEEGNIDQNTHQAELAAETAGASYADDTRAGRQNTTMESLNQRPPSNAAKKRRLKHQKEEELERRLGMASRRNRKLYERMMHGKHIQDEETAQLRNKRRRIEENS